MSNPAKKKKKHNKNSKNCYYEIIGMVFNTFVLKN